MTRRELLAGAAAGAASLALAPGCSEPSSAAAPALRKCISMGGPAPLHVAGHANDYLLHGNREYIRDLSTTRWVKLWVSWGRLQEDLRPADRQESWAQLNSAPHGRAALRRLDRQIRAINDDSLAVGGMGVILTLYQEYPLWSSGARRGDPRRAGAPLAAKVPEDLSPRGPWAWFVSHLCARYRRGAPPNPIGPREAGPRLGGPPHDPRAGNPDGAFVDALEICNEPNLLLWPQHGMPDRVAAMIETACQVSALEGGPPILAPATADAPDPRRPDRADTDWRSFTQRLLGALEGRDLVRHIGWSHHNYRDVANEVSAPASRARAVVALLDDAGWRGGGGPRLWLTEGGYNLYPRQDARPAQEAQAAKIEGNFLAMSAEPEVFLWTQHAINDVEGNRYKSGLRGDFVEGRGPSAARPAWETWRRLAGSSRAWPPT